jgi:hypothetical protein
MKLKKCNIIIGDPNSSRVKFAISLSKFANLDTYYFGMGSFGEKLSSGEYITIDDLCDLEPSCVILYLDYSMCYLPNKHTYILIIHNDNRSYREILGILKKKSSECKFMFTHRNINSDDYLTYNNTIYTLESLTSDFRDEKINDILE